MPFMTVMGVILYMDSFKMLSNVINVMLNNKACFSLIVLCFLMGCGRQHGYVGFSNTHRISIEPERVLVLGQEDGRRIETEASASAVDLIVRDSLLIFSRFGGNTAWLQLTVKRTKQGALFFVGGGHLVK